MKLTVRGHEIAGLLDRAPAGISVLSLDCFDTLIWRTTHAPHDVFAELDLPGGGIEPRQWAEQLARRIARQRDGALEVGLDDIHRAMRPHADAAQVAEHVAHELAVEANHAFAYAPVVELIATAKRRGLKVVIVSDMYLNEAQLRGHITAAAGPALMAAIDEIFVSSAFGCSKESGLFDIVLDRLGVRPDQVLHVGDNPAADYHGAVRHGLHAAHFVQFDDATVQRLRHEAVAATLIDPRARVSRPICQPHRAPVSLRRRDDVAYTVGHDVVGPALHVFVQWLKREIDASAGRLGRPVRPLFMMRDGYLPWRVFAAMYPDAGARPVEISRFVGMRASLHDEAALERFVAEWAAIMPTSVLARQLMLFEGEISPFLKDEDAPERREAFARFLRKPDVRRRILKRAHGFGDKLIAHLRAQDVAPGDAVMLVDLGYNGTVQNIVEPMLRARMGLDIAGRYVFLRETQATGLDKRGMLDASRFENRTLHGLSTCVAVIEQLCNVEQGSTINFQADGTPMREAPDMKAAHNAARAVAQQGCLDFVAGARAGMTRPPAADTLDNAIHAGAAALARLFFMPSSAEVELFATFNHDVNMGSKLSHALFDQADSATALRQRGLGFINDRRRMFLPADLHAQGLPLTLASFAAHRFGLDLRMTDFEVGGIAVGTILMTATEELVQAQTAWPTCDGFYRLSVAVGASRPAVAVQIGALAPFVEIEAVGFERIVDGEANGKVVAAQPVADAMEPIGDGLWRADPAGFLFIQPPPQLAGPMLMNLVFRPIGRREAAPLRLAA